MADTFTLDNFTGLTENTPTTGQAGSSLSTGDLRRRYNFGSDVSMLAVQQDPFFFLLSKYRKSPTDDPQFKFTEERQSFYRRYAYPVAHSTDGSTWTANNATITIANVAVGKTFYIRLKGDYKTAGNIGSRFGNVNSKVDIGDSGTRPQFVMPNQMLKVICSDTDFETPNDYFVMRVVSTENSASEGLDVRGIIVRAPDSSTDVELQWSSATAPMTTTYNVANANSLSGLESKKVYVVGSAFARGSGYPDTWADNPYSTSYGQTQIWKTALAMDNSTRATVLKYAGNEFARIWANKLIDHKWDIETDLLFSNQYVDADGIQYTQGVVDYITQFGNLFTLDLTSKNYDNFLDDLSQLLDPRQTSTMATVFMCDTETFNWMNKLSGYFNNNINIDTQFQSDFQFSGRGMVGGRLPVTKISTIYGDMNIVRNVHLDGTGYRIVAVDMNKVAYRPLVGNGINRDTAVYVGVQTLENTGVDKRVDLIQTEAGLQIAGPECHSIWK